MGGRSRGTQHEAFCADAGHLSDFAGACSFRPDCISSQDSQRQPARILDCDYRLCRVGCRLRAQGCLDRRRDGGGKCSDDEPSFPASKLGSGGRRLTPPSFPHPDEARENWVRSATRRRQLG